MNKRFKLFIFLIISIFIFIIMHLTSCSLIWGRGAVFDPDWREAEIKYYREKGDEESVKRLEKVGVEFEAEQESNKKRLLAVGTKADFNTENPDSQQEGNPNKTLGEIGGQDEPKVESVTLHGYLTGLEAHPLTITIYFASGAVDGSFYHSAEGNCMIWDRDDKGKMIPGTKKKVYARYEIKGKITGWINLKTYAITGDMTCTGSIVYAGKVYPVDEPGKVSGYLDKNNHLSCTVDNGYNITASP